MAKQKSGTETSSFGVSKREGHDSSKFYDSRLFEGFSQQEIPEEELQQIEIPTSRDWADQIYAKSSESMDEVPDNAVALAVTSPPYNVNKDYDEDLNLDEYLELIARVSAEAYRTLQPGGRYAINIANLGRKPYLPMHAFFYQLHTQIGFLPLGEIIWQKAKGANGSTAWGSWMSAKAPRLRDVHEYILIFAKQSFSRPDKGESDIEKEDFMAGTLSVWDFPPESAQRIGHPAPYPVALIERLVRLFTYQGDVVLDPFMGSGSTALAALKAGRHYVGYEIEPEYIDLAEKRISELGG